MSLLTKVHASKTATNTLNLAYSSTILISYLIYSIYYIQTATIHTIIMLLFIDTLYNIVTWVSLEYHGQTLTSNTTRETAYFANYGFILFIISEINIFFSLFFVLIYLTKKNFIWNYKSYPNLFFSISPIHIPFINTIILLLSSILTIWIHQCYYQQNKYNIILCYIATIYLGYIFLAKQITEYMIYSISIKNNIYTSIIFFLTGCHGLHVIIGLLLLLCSFVTTCLMTTTKYNNNIVIIAIWYWHFVDFIWMFVYICIYIL